MRILLDTQVWLWSLVSPERLGSRAQALLRDAGNTLYLSAASSWEMAIKYRLGKLPLPEPPELFVPPRLVRDRITPLPIEHVHALHVAALPEHHGDPFDRLLVAQARVEGLAVLTADPAFSSYDVEVIAAR